MVGSTIQAGVRRVEGHMQIAHKGVMHEIRAVRLVRILVT
jgi:hypothetical protein